MNLFKIVSTMIVVIAIIWIGGCGLLIWGGVKIGQKVEKDGLKGVATQVWEGTNKVSQ